MRRTSQVLAGLLVGGGALLGASPASAQTVDCAVYPQSCVKSTVVEDRVLGEVLERSSGSAGNGAVNGRSAGTPSSLPFTGDEVRTLGLLGAGALAAGAAMVVAGRRRNLGAA